MFSCFLSNIFQAQRITYSLYKIINPKGDVIHNDTIQTLPELGFCRDNFKGNLLIKFNVDYPKKLKPEYFQGLQNNVELMKMGKAMITINTFTQEGISNGCSGIIYDFL